MELGVKITGVLSVLIAVGFMIFLYLRYLNNKKANNSILYEKEQFKYPDCPDFFEIVSDSDGKKHCENVYNIGKCRKKGVGTGNGKISFDENTLFNNTKDGNYWKCRWAKECEVPWDGINKLC